MEIIQKEVTGSGVRFSVQEEGREIGHAYLYILTNDLHRRPFGFMEDVEVEPEHRKEGIGSQLVKMVVETAKERGCYKLVATSRHERPKVHELYERLGFRDHGVEFRVDF